MSPNAHKSMLIVAGGQPPDPEKLRQWAGRYEAIIAADSGLETLEMAGLEPAFVIGDFDSVADEVLAAMEPSILIENEAQEDTDLEKAILLALKQGADRIGLAGASGNRIDHTLNAISLMLRYREHADFIFHDDGGTARIAVPPEAVIHGQSGQRVSFVPAPAATGLTGEGLAYPLEKLDLTLGGRDAISNELIDEVAYVRFSGGSFLVYLQDDE
jgi:thiamine pyrophosphokinase